MWDQLKSKLQWFRGSFQEYRFPIMPKGEKLSGAQEKNNNEEVHAWLQGEIMLLPSIPKGDIVG